MWNFLWFNVTAKGFHSQNFCANQAKKCAKTRNLLLRFTQKFALRNMWKYAIFLQKIWSFRGNPNNGSRKYNVFTLDLDKCWNSIFLNTPLNFILIRILDPRSVLGQFFFFLTQPSWFYWGFWGFNGVLLGFFWGLFWVFNFK